MEEVIICHQNDKHEDKKDHLDPVGQNDFGHRPGRKGFDTSFVAVFGSQNVLDVLFPVPEDEQGHERGQGHVEAQKDGVASGVVKWPELVEDVPRQHVHKEQVEPAKENKEVSYQKGFCSW